MNIKKILKYGLIIVGVQMTISILTAPEKTPKTPEEISRQVRSYNYEKMKQDLLHVSIQTAKQSLNYPSTFDLENFIVYEKDSTAQIIYSGKNAFGISSEHVIQISFKYDLDVSSSFIITDLKSNNYENQSNSHSRARQVHGLFVLRL